MAGLHSLICSDSKQLVTPNFTVAAKVNGSSPTVVSKSPSDASLDGKNVTKRRLALLGAGALATGLLKKSPAFAKEVPKNYKSYVDAKDGYSYLYPADWRHSKTAMWPCSVSGWALFLLTTDIRDLGPMDEAIFNLVNNVYAAPNQVPMINDMQERTVDDKNYWTLYDLEAPGYGVSAFATVAIGNVTASLLKPAEQKPSILHAAWDGQRAPVEQAAEQAQSGGRLFQDL